MTQQLKGSGTIVLDIKTLSVFITIITAIGGGFWFAGQMASNFQNLSKNG